MSITLQKKKTKKQNKEVWIKLSKLLNSNHRVFSHDVTGAILVFQNNETAAILVFQNNETAAMLVFQTNPVGVELFSHVNTFVCSNRFT